ncbi:ECF transporter S component [Atrimonas thermophila]|uniref:ECF transporter S component n=1 Tax=Atrimonas thermophila TaxID=3064161 RepID=UPI00399D34B0
MQAREITKMGVLIAIGVALPYFFHFTGIPGQVFLPMHIPVLLGGFLLRSGGEAFLVGLILPVLSFLISGRPVFPSLVAMMFELGVYGLSAFLFYQRLRWGILSSLVVAVFLGRGAFILSSWILFSLLGRSFGLLPLLQTLFIVALPGILIQLVLIPLLVAALLKSRKESPRFF